jgi:hypothetical protein
MHRFGRQVYQPEWQRQFALGVNVPGLMPKALLGDPIGRIIDPFVA